MVIVVGTSHSIQLGTEGINHSVCEELRVFLEDLCRTYDIRTIAEEMSAEALTESKCANSVPMRLDESLQLQHWFCDPGRLERVRLGIYQENDIRAQAFLSGWSESEISARILASHAIRERYWLNELRALNHWPVLFVCGADHVASFCALLRGKASPQM